LEGAGGRRNTSVHETTAFDSRKKKKVQSKKRGEKGDIRVTKPPLSGTEKAIEGATEGAQEDKRKKSRAAAACKILGSKQRSTRRKNDGRF